MQFHKDLAAQIQAEFEEACTHLINDVLTRTGSSNLVLSGGCFLNSMLNARVAREFDLENIHIFPAATDDGNAVGAALYAHHVLLKDQTHGGAPEPATGTGGGGAAMRHTFLGPARLTTEPDHTIDALARKWGLSAVCHHSPRSAAQAGALAIARGEIIGWFQDRAEFGPRALGSRSILCHPGITGMKDRLNARVKFRESFRPFAASILAEHAAQWFDLPARDSPFMLMICPARPEFADLVAEVVHVDGTSRLQTVGPDLPGSFRALIEEFHRLTGLPLVLNTSLNIRGKPIVEDPRHTMEFLYGTRLDRLFLGDHEIEGPDLAALYPQRSETAPARHADPHVEQVLEYATGDLQVRKIAIALGVTEDEAVDLTLDLRRRGLVRWVAVPSLPEPRFPLPQYDSEGGG
jgi:carbamoyltransferase